MIARSFRPVGWVAAVGAAALGCYMLSLRVASERADLDRLNHRIVAASQNIRSLQTELGTRGRMQQLEAWNEEVLALSAPVSGQFVEGSVSLARFDTRQSPSAVEAPVQLASAVSTPAPAPAPRPAVATPRQAVAAPVPAQSLVRQASAVIPPVTTAPATTAATTVRRAAAPATTAARRPAPTEAAPIRTASRETAPARTATPPVKRPVATATETRTAAATTPARSRPAGLLDDRTIRALGSASRSERGGGTHD
jgi:hypothetical protein